MLAMASWRKWLHDGAPMLVAAAAALVIVGHVTRQPAVLHLSTAGIKWTDALLATSTFVTAVITLIAVLYVRREYRHNRAQAAIEAGLRRELAVSRCDVAVRGDCFAYQGRDLVRAHVSVRNHSTAKLQFLDGDKGPFVMVHAISADMLSGPISSTFEEIAPLTAAEVLHGHFLESGETLTHSVLLPLERAESVAAYRVEFGVSVLEPSDGKEYDWRAVDFVPVEMSALTERNAPDRCMMKSWESGLNALRRRLRSYGK
jgi:hypothetical protein